VIGNSLKSSPNFPSPSTGHTPFNVSGAPSSCKLSNNLTRTLRRGAFQLRVTGLFQSQTTMIRLTFCRVRRAATLPRQTLKRSQISILAVVLTKKSLDCYLTPGKSNRTLNHSFCAISDEYCTSPSIYRKTSRICLFQFLSFQTPSIFIFLRCCIASPNG